MIPVNKNSGIKGLENRESVIFFSVPMEAGAPDDQVLMNGQSLLDISKYGWLGLFEVQIQGNEFEKEGWRYYNEYSK